MSTFDDKIKGFQARKDDLRAKEKFLAEETKKFSEEFQDFMKENFNVKDGEEFHLSDIIMKARLL